MADLRIFSYLPNPRIWKATIAARLGGVELDVRGAKRSELTNWLWDFDARPLSAEQKDAYASAARKGRVGFKGGKRGLAPVLADGWREAYPRAAGHLERLCDHPAFAPDVRPYLAKLEALAT